MVLLYNLSIHIVWYALMLMPVCSAALSSKPVAMLVSDVVFFNLIACVL